MARILYLSPYWPHRGTCASELRALHIGRALQECGRVEVVVVGGEDREREWVDQQHKAFSVACGVAVEALPPRRYREKLAWAINPRTSYPHGSGVNRAALERVLRISRDFDLLWFCKFRTPNMFPQFAWSRSVLDIDDVTSTYEQAVLKTERRWRERLLTKVRIGAWRRRERVLGERFTVLAVCSENDRQYMRTLGITTPIHVIPNGYERPLDIPHRSIATPPRIGFIGIFDYEANLDGIQWFARECWPRIKSEIPDTRLRLVGRFSDGPLKPTGLDIDGLGFVEDADAELSTWSAMIVPIRLGAGTRGKIAHAFARRCPVVSTTLGAYGYEAANGRELYLADSAADFASACVRAIRHPAEAAEIADRAWQQFSEKWAWDAIRPRVWAAAEDCLRLSDGAVAGGDVR
jgi:glycosyltransferase involved in cell wall biosynthesis